jgi:hypothetical protein
VKLVKYRPALTIALGIVILLGGFIFWLLTERASALWVGAGLALVGVGQFAVIRATDAEDEREEEAIKEALLAYRDARRHAATGADPDES